MTKQKRISIVGAGIGGLCTALTMARKGHVVRIFEQSPVLEEIGAGLQLSPNATRVLQRLGLTQDLARSWYEPDNLRLVSGLSLRPLTELPVGAASKNRWKAPYAVIHRARLQEVLLHACRQCEPIELEFARRIEDRPPGEADLLVAADGVWSHLRESIPGSARPRFAGHVAWRTTVPMAGLEHVFPSRDVTALLGPGAHLVAYRIGPDVMNLVATTPGRPGEKGWNLSGDVGRLVSAFGGWHRSIVPMLERATWRHWPIYEVGDGAWHDAERRTVLLGDAAHAMPPHAAQGAAMAIEDASELASCLAQSGDDIAKAMNRFATLRKPRIRRIRQRGLLNKFAYQAVGPFRLGRNIVFSMLGPERLTADLDWLYGYEAKS